MKTVMIVDDDPFLVSVYQTKFQAEGFAVHTAAGGIEALDALKSVQVDVVVLDLQLPGMSGSEVLRKIRADKTTCDTPVVVFSNAFLGNVVQAAWQAGATHVLSKTNCTPNELVDAVRKAATRKTEVRPHRSPSVVVSSDLSPEPHLRFAESAPQMLAGIGEGLQRLLAARGQGAVRESLESLSRSVRALTGAAGAAGFPRIAQMAGALEALFDELRSRPVGITVSTLRTAVRGAQALTILCSHAEESLPAFTRLPLVLIVDDDPLGRQAVESALEAVGVRFISLGAADVALAVLAENPFDLVLLDVEMPDINGFGVCRRMRATPVNCRTPVIFVTALENFDELARDQLPERGEVIAKPFPLIELGVKALTYLLSVPDAAGKQGTAKEPVAKEATA